MTSPATRMRAPSQKIQTIETDIVIIGGGVAGCMAALGAAEVGARTVICEKGPNRGSSESLRSLDWTTRRDRIHPAHP